MYSGVGNVNLGAFCRLYFGKPLFSVPGDLFSEQTESVRFTRSRSDNFSCCRMQQVNNIKQSLLRELKKLLKYVSGA